MGNDRLISTGAFAEAACISPQMARKACRQAIKGKPWRDCNLLVRVTSSSVGGGKSGLRYEVLLSSLPEAVQRAFNGDLDDEPCTALVPYLTPTKFIAARHQTAEEERRYNVLRHILHTERGTKERAAAIRGASHHHGVPTKTIRNWLNRLEQHGGDLDALGRKRPADSGKPRAKVCLHFDKHFRAAGYAESDLDDLALWFRREVAGWWQSPVQRAGWKRVKLEVETSLRIKCEDRGFALPRAAFNIPRSQIEPLRYHSAVDIMKHDAKRHDNAKARIRRDNSRFRPMEQVVMDVKPLDCVLQRPDGSLAYPKLLGFMDTGTHRLFGRIILLPQGEGVRQEHVTDAFLDMVQDPDWGFPQQLYCDNGSEYKHFDLIREAIKMVAEEGARVIIHAKPYSGASKPIESKFSVIDRQITSLMDGYTGSNRMDKKIHRMGKKAIPYAGSVEQFEEEFFLRLTDFHAMPIGSGPFKGRSPLEIYHAHVDDGWRPVRVNRFALDCAFSKQLGHRKVDRGAIQIDGQRYRDSNLASLAGRRVQVVKPYRREAWPLANLPKIGWVELRPEMLSLPGDISGAIDAGRMQRKHNRGVRSLKAEANMIDPAANVRRRVTDLPTRAAPAPLIDVMMSEEAERFAGARIEAQRKREAQPTAAQRLIAAQLRETEDLERYINAKRR